MRGGCSLVILAGGLSRRMGRDKAALPAGDGTLIEHIARRLAPVVEETIVAGASGRHHLRGTTMVDDRYPGLGPLAGIHAGLLVARSPLAWVAGCALPDVDPGLAALLRRLTGEVDAAVAPLASELQPASRAYARGMTTRSYPRTR